MKKIVTALMFVIMLASSASAVKVIEPEGLSGSALAELLDVNTLIDGAVIGGTEIPYDDTPLMFSAENASRVDIAITPSGSGFAGTSMNAGGNLAVFPSMCVWGTAAAITDTNPREFTVTVTASDTEGNTDKKTYSLKIYPDAAINAAEPGVITWGKEYSFTPSGAGVSAWDIVSEGLDSTYLTELPDGLEFDYDTGRIFGTWKAGEGEAGLAFGRDKKEITRKIRLTAEQDVSGKTVSHDYTLKFAAVAPVITDNAETLTKEYFSKMYDEDIDAVITAEGPGVISWTVDKLPAGLEIESNDSDGVSELSITGTPAALMKAQEVTITATNSAGSAVIKPVFSIYENPDVPAPGNTAGTTAKQETKASSEAPKTPAANAESSGGSSMCNSGFGIMALMIAGALLLRRK